MFGKMGVFSVTASQTTCCGWCLMVVMETWPPQHASCLTLSIICLFFLCHTLLCVWLIYIIVDRQGKQKVMDYKLKLTRT